MTTQQEERDNHDISAAMSHLVGRSVCALALVCTIGEGARASVTAYITPRSAGSPLFRHAIEMEGAYYDTLLSFEDGPQPFYGSGKSMDLRKAALQLGVDRVLCAVTLDIDGEITAVRDYDGVEVTLLDAAKEQFKRFAGMLQTESLTLNRTLQ